jgi:signal transduction histidine kinase
MERTLEDRTPSGAHAAAPQSPARGAGPAPMSAEAVVRDLQSVLGAAVERLHESIGCELVAAWALRESGEPYVAAASFSGSPPAQPAREAFDRLGELPGAIDLREAGRPPDLRKLAEELACSAAAPVVANDGTPMAVLLLREANPDSAAVRPRTLAALETARRRLEVPLSAAVALGRLRAIDDEVCRLDRLAALGSLASEIAHEVRNPLVSIKTFLQLLPERRGDPDFFTSFFEVASEELRRMERLLDGVVEQARPRNLGAAGVAVDVAAIIESVGELVRHRAVKRGISLTWQVAPHLPVISVEDDALRQIVLNLTLNAIDATPDGGSVCLSATAANGGVAIHVADSGPGVPEELRRKIFEPFFSTNSHRSGGLGLAITHRVVEAANGTITVAESAQGGAEFRVQLPAG